MKIKTITLALAAAVLTATVALQAKDGDVEVGAAAPNFTLTDTNGKTHALSDFKGSYVVLEWVNHGCPFVKKHYESNNMQGLQKWATEKKVVWLSVCSSADGKQGNMTPAEWNETIKKTNTAATAVLLDANGKVGKTYDAKTTPAMYVIAPDGTLIYKGAIDDKPTPKQSDIPGSKNYVKAALEEAMAGKKVTVASTQSYGCSVKY